MRPQAACRRHDDRMASDMRAEAASMEVVSKWACQTAWTPGAVWRACAVVRRCRSRRASGDSQWLCASCSNGKNWLRSCMKPAVISLLCLLSCRKPTQPEQATMPRRPGLLTQTHCKRLIQAGRQGRLTSAWKQLFSYGVAAATPET